MEANAYYGEVEGSDSMMYEDMDDDIILTITLDEKYQDDSLLNVMMTEIDIVVAKYLKITNRINLDVVEHIDGNTLNNVRSNLRLVVQ